MEKYLERGRGMWPCFIDLEKAFDSQKEENDGWKDRGLIKESYVTKRNNESK